MAIKVQRDPSGGYQIDCDCGQRATIPPPPGAGTISSLPGASSGRSGASSSSPTSSGRVPVNPSGHTTALEVVVKSGELSIFVSFLLQENDTTDKPAISAAGQIWADLGGGLAESIVCWPANKPVQLSAIAAEMSISGQSIEFELHQRATAQAT